MKTALKKILYQEIIPLIQALVIVVILNAFVFMLFYVPTGSMKNTILEGDYLFGTKYSYGYSKFSFPFNLNLFDGKIFNSSPNRGDVIILVPKFDENIKYIKRVIGIGGDKIQVINDIVYLNDQELVRKYIKTEVEDGISYDIYEEFLEHISYNIRQISNKPLHEKQKFNNIEFVIPENAVFVMGDNRDDSRDSRYDLSYVDNDRIIAKIHFMYFSNSCALFPTIPELHKIRCSKTNYDEDANFFVSIYNWFKNIRYNRMFKQLKN
jgi:signal peptidase I